MRDERLALYVCVRNLGRSTDCNSQLAQRTLAEGGGDVGRALQSHISQYKARPFSHFNVSGILETLKQ